MTEFIEERLPEATQASAQRLRTVATQQEIETSDICADVGSSSMVKALFADDGQGSGHLIRCHAWTTLTHTFGASWGFYVNLSKTAVVVKPRCEKIARALFQDLPDIKIIVANNADLNSADSKESDVDSDTKETGGRPTMTTSGVRDLGAPLGSDSFTNGYVQSKVEKWREELSKLCDIAVSEPQAAYSFYAQCLSHKWMFLVRMVPGISQLMKPIEDLLGNRFIPLLFYEDANTLMMSTDFRSWMEMPCRLSGLAIVNPTRVADIYYQDATAFLQPLVTAITLGPDGPKDWKYNKIADRERAKEMREMRNERWKEFAANLRDSASDKHKRIMDLLKLPAASMWLTTRPLKEFDFVLNRRQFRDTMCSRYGLRPQGLRQVCQCGKPNDLDHPFSCPNGGFRTKVHNEIVQTVASIARSAGYNDQSIEPDHLELLPGQDPSELKSAYRAAAGGTDLRINGFNTFSRDCFFDITGINPFAPSYNDVTPTALFTRRENAKRRKYEDRITQVDNGDFIPLVFLTSGSWSPTFDMVLCKMASRRARRSEQQYSSVLLAFRRSIAFIIAKSISMMLRGTRFSAIRLTRMLGSSGESYAFHSIRPFINGLGF